MIIREVLGKHMDFEKAFRRISEKDLRVLWRVSHILAEAEGYDQIGEVLFREIQPVVPGEMGVIIPFNPVTNAHIPEGICTKNIPDSQENVRRYNERYHLLDPYCGQRNPIYQNKAVTEADLMKRPEFENSEFYTDFLAPQGIYGNMCLGITALGKTVGSIIFPVTSRTRKYGLKERSALTLLAPALAGAFFRTAVCEGYFQSPTPGLLAKWQRQFNLSRREGEIVGLVINGLSNKAIGEKLHISEKTVKTHMSSIMNKTRVNSRAALMSAILNRNPSVFDL